MSAIDRDAAIIVLKAFGKAFNSGDIDGILGQVTDDFEWRLHEGPDTPDGRVVKGREAVRGALEARAKLIERLRFSETELMFGDNHIVGRFRATGAYKNGQIIDVRGTDIYSFRDGKISIKDSYWKRIT
ncbi:MAG: nuclear transport factor 2 family protein [Alphaproteobacteria bacterium]|jgi:ketosteroid isomerase-like protein